MHTCTGCRVGLRIGARMDVAWYSVMAAATDTLKLCTMPAMGIMNRTSACSSICQCVCDMTG